MQFRQQFQSGSVTLHENARPSVRSRPVIDEGPLRIHIGNIPFSWSEKHLREQFEIFGPVDDVEVVSNAQGSKGFGFLTFLRRHDGERAMQVKNGTIADGRKITVSLAVAKNHSISSLLSSPPATPARTAFQSLSSNLSMPAKTKSSFTSLSPDAPLWMPATPPSSTIWPLSPDSQTTAWINHSPPLSSSPLSMLFPPLLPSSCVGSIEDEKIVNRWQSFTAEPPIREVRVCCSHCPHCGRSIQ